MLKSPLYLRTLRNPRTKRVQPANLPTHRTVKLGNSRRKMPVAYFWKDVISPGTFVHPITGLKFVVTKKRIKGWLDKYTKMKKAGIEIPTPVDHSEKAEDNRGFIVDARRRNGKLQMLHQVIGKDGVAIASRNRCSVFIDPDFKDEKGKNWGEAITHSAFTPKPVISGHGEFVPFAASRAGSGKQSKVPIYYLSRTTKESVMTKTKKKKAGKGLSSLTPKEQKLVRRMLDVEDDVELKDNESLRRLVALAKTQQKALKASGSDLAQDDEDEDEDDDAEEVDELEDSDTDDEDEDDEDDEDEDTDVVDEDADDEDDEDEDEDEDADSEVDAIAKQRRKKGKNSKNRKRVLSERRNREVRRLAPSVGALSRVPKDADPATLALVKRSLKTERRRCIDRGAITPDVDKELAALLLTGGKPNALALSRVAGSDDPLAFRIYDILRRNKPVPKSNRTGNQESLVLSRREPGGNAQKKEEAEIERLKKETRKNIRSQQKKNGIAPNLG